MMDWGNEAAVIRYAETLGHGMTVIKRYDRNNYNIIHTSREKDLLRLGDRIIKRT